MNLPIRTLGLRRHLLRDRVVLALDTGFGGDSLEGLRLVKASRGQGWFFSNGVLQPWVTKGVFQESGRLMVWGELTSVPEGADAGPWPVTGVEGREFLRAFVQAWTARAAVGEALPPFSPSAVLPWRVDGQWAFVFPPVDLRGALDSLQPIGERLPWEHFRHPDLGGGASWAFTSAALGVQVASSTLPWVQDDEEHLRQEVRDLPKTLRDDELPVGPDEGTLKLWFDSLTGRAGSKPDARWKAWAAEAPSWNSAPAQPPRDQGRPGRRDRRRAGAAFWRRKGTLVTVAAGILGLVAVIVGSVVWGAVKPNPTDHWTAEEVVRGYYAAIDNQDAELLKLLTRGSSLEGSLGRDQDEATNLFVIRQVRTAYEQKSPILLASEWEKAGRPPVKTGQMLFGIAGLTLSHQSSLWTAEYRKWASEVDEKVGLRVLGESVTDELTLVQTDRGWKVFRLQRQKHPLP